MDTVRKTERHKTYEAWTGDVGLYLKVGDSVCEALQVHFREVSTITSGEPLLLQLGAADHRGRFCRTLFETLQKHSDAWIYTGARTRGELVQIVGSERIADNQSEYTPPGACFREGRVA